MQVDDILQIRMVEVPISITPVKVLAPEYLMGADKPLAIRLKEDGKKIQIWGWDQPLVSMAFMVIKDNSRVVIRPDGLRLRRHFGTVFDNDGKALHLLHLYGSQ